MLAYRSRMKSALDELDVAPIPAEWRDNNRILLENNLAFVDDCLAKGTISFASLEAFSKKQGRPYLKLNVAWAAQTQVAHWMPVLADWKAMLGSEWDKAYGATNTIIAENAKRGTKPFLPPVVSWGSQQWPMLVAPGSGARFPQLAEECSMNLNTITEVKRPASADQITQWRGIILTASSNALNNH
jgi:hypothetical protein